MDASAILDYFAPLKAWLDEQTKGQPIGWSADAAPPARTARADAESAIAAIRKDRADTEKWLQSDPGSYLAAVDRRDFGPDQILTIGRAADNDVRLDDPGVLPHHLRVAVEGDRFHLKTVDAGARFAAVKDETQVAGGDRAVAKQEALVGPSSIGIGRFQLRLSHQGFPAIIVFDPKSPHFKAYKGLAYFPIDLAYRYELPLTPNPHPDNVIVMSTRGNRRPARRIGWFEFDVGGTPCRLEAVRLLEPGVGENDISIFFRDATTGKETYPVGRYVDPKKLPNGKYLVDFNFAYNPACAFSDFYNCPIPSEANTLAVAIRAGETDAHYH
jgi:uncharacterized protein (DUF1684 family)